MRPRGCCYMTRSRFPIPHAQDLEFLWRRRHRSGRRAAGAGRTTSSSNADPHGQRLKVLFWHVVSRQVPEHLLVLVVEALRRIPSDDEVFRLRLLQISYEGVAQAETQVVPFIDQQM